MLQVLVIGECNGIEYDLQLSGQHTVSTVILQEPIFLSPWNVSIQYDDVYWASMDAPTNETSVVPQYILNKIIVWACNSGYYLIGDVLHVQIYIDGTLFQDVFIQYDLEPIYPVNFVYFAPQFTPQTMYSLYNVIYGPISVTLQITSDPIVQWEFEMNVYDFFGNLLQTITAKSQSIFYPNGCYSLEPYTQYFPLVLNGLGYIISTFNITYPTSMPIYASGCYKTTKNINGEEVTEYVYVTQKFTVLSVSGLFVFT